MRKIYLALLSIFCLALSLTSAFADAPTPTKKTWTMLVYLNGNNSLDSFGKENIIDMEKVGSNDQVNVVVQWASMRAKKAVRLLVLKGKDSTRVNSPIIEDLGNVDMGSYKTLEEFIAWGVKKYPADHYFIDVWDHGSGWHSLTATASPLIGDISWDDNTGNSITTEQLGQVMAYAAKLIGHKVDLYGSDACLMGMAEVANEMKDSVAYSVGSEETEPGAGWPYSNILKRWQTIPNATSQQVAKILVNAYIRLYNNKDEVTMSAFDLSKLDAFNKAISDLNNNMQSLNPVARKRVLSASQQTLRFAFRDYADVQDFMTKLEFMHIKLDPKVIANVKSATTDLVIANGFTSQFKDASGIAMWLPTSKGSYNQYADRYTHMIFNVESNWKSALSWMLQGSN